MRWRDVTVVGAEHIGDRAPDRPLVVCDLGLPKDVDPAAAAPAPMMRVRRPRGCRPKWRAGPVWS